MMQVMNLPTMLVCIGLQLMILGDNEDKGTRIIGCIFGIIGWILNMLIGLKGI